VTIDPEFGPGGTFVGEGLGVSAEVERPAGDGAIGGDHDGVKRGAGRRGGIRKEEHVDGFGRRMIDGGDTAVIGVEVDTEGADGRGNVEAWRLVTKERSMAGKDDRRIRNQVAVERFVGGRCEVVEKADAETVGVCGGDLGVVLPEAFSEGGMGEERKFGIAARGAGVDNEGGRTAVPVGKEEIVRAGNDGVGGVDERIEIGPRNESGDEIGIEEAGGGETLGEEVDLGKVTPDDDAIAWSGERLDESTDGGDVAVDGIHFAGAPGVVGDECDRDGGDGGGRGDATSADR